MTERKKLLLGLTAGLSGLFVLTVAAVTWRMFSDPWITGWGV